MKIAILASGNGSNAQAIIDSAKAGHLQAEVVLILSNRASAHALKRGANSNIQTRFIDPGQFMDRSAYDQELLEEIHRSGADCVCLAGYMLLLTRSFLDGFKGPVLNIHPSLLPSFSGTRGVADACAHGVKITGVTVHFVSEEMDMGPIIIQAALPLPDNEDMESFMQKVHGLEHRIYPQAIQWLAQDRIRIEGRRTVLLPAESRLAPPESGHIVWPPLEEGF